MKRLGSAPRHGRDGWHVSGHLIKLERSFTETRPRAYKRQLIKSLRNTLGLNVNEAGSSIMKRINANKPDNQRQPAGGRKDGEEDGWKGRIKGGDTVREEKEKEKMEQEKVLEDGEKDDERERKKESWRRRRWK